MDVNIVTGRMENHSAYSLRKSTGSSITNSEFEYLLDKHMPRGRFWWVLVNREQGQIGPQGYGGCYGGMAQWAKGLLDNHRELKDWACIFPLNIDHEHKRQLAQNRNIRYFLSSIIQHEDNPYHDVVRLAQKELGFEGDDMAYINFTIKYGLYIPAKFYWGAPKAMVYLFAMLFRNMWEWDLGQFRTRHFSDVFAALRASKVFIAPEWRADGTLGGHYGLAVKFGQHCVINAHQDWFSFKRFWYDGVISKLPFNKSNSYAIGVDKTWHNGGHVLYNIMGPEKIQALYNKGASAVGDYFQEQWGADKIGFDWEAEIEKATIRTYDKFDRNLKQAVFNYEKEQIKCVE